VPQIVDLEPIMAAQPFFADMEKSALDTIVGCARNVVYRPGVYIYRQHEPADHFYVIREGRVALEIYVPGREAIVVETLETGDIFGWSWLIAPYAWSNDARSADTVRALQFDAACLRGKLESDKVLGYEIYRRFVPVMARRLAANRLRIVELATEPAVYEA
jgi:CRP-like cAMP-binding protein